MAQDLQNALKEIYTKQMLDRINDGGKIVHDRIDQVNWDCLAAQQEPLEEWTSSLPLGSLVASALTPLLKDTTSGSLLLQKQGLKKCSKTDLKTACFSMMGGLIKLLGDAIDDMDLASSARPGRLSSPGSVEIPPGRSFDAVADDEEVTQQFFDKMRRSKDQILEEDIEKELANLPHSQEMVGFLHKLKPLCPLSYDRLRSLVKETPRLSGQRIVWSASLSMETLFGKYLRAGSIFDGLDGIKEMKFCELRSACRKFSSELPTIVQREWTKITHLDKSNSQGKSGFQGIMNKFIDEGGFVGRFGNVNMFHEGLESQIGYPNPKLLKAILREHCFSADSEGVVVTGNYGIAFSPIQEFARLLCKDQRSQNMPMKLPAIEFLKNESTLKHANSFKGPTLKELDEVVDELKKLQKTYASVMKRKNSVFPGECGDEYQESVCEIKIDCGDKDAHCISQEWSSIISVLHERFTEFLAGKADKNGRRSNVDVRDAEAIARGIKTHHTITSDTSHLVAKISIPISQRERNEKFKFEENFEEILNLKKKKYSFNWKQESVPNTTFFVDDLSHYGSQLSEPVLEKHLRQMSSEKLLARFKTVANTNPSNWKKGMSGFDNETLIKQLIKKQKAMSHCKQARRRLSLMELMDIPKVKLAKLRVEEAIVVYQYTGPLFQVFYN